jgi:hypothetical protein
VTRTREAGAGCPACSRTELGPLYPGLVRCRGCGYVFADLRLRDEEWSALYAREYFFGGEYRDYLADERILRKNFARRMAVLGRFLDPGRHRRLLEVGSAYGFFLDLVRDRFERVQGLDIGEDGVRHARERFGLEVTRADLLGHDLGDETFDVVCLWDTIEHLRFPQETVAKLARHTASGALLALTTGDIESLNARLRGRRWRLIHPPTHAHYFSRRTLRALLARHGFRVVYERYCGFYRSVESAAYQVLVLRHGRAGLYRLLRGTGLLAFDLYLNLGDILYVIARKA